LINKWNKLQTHFVSRVFGCLSFKSTHRVEKKRNWEGIKCKLFCEGFGYRRTNVWATPPVREKLIIQFSRAKSFWKCKLILTVLSEFTSKLTSYSLLSSNSKVLVLESKFHKDKICENKLRVIDETFEMESFRRHVTLSNVFYLTQLFP
jgi:hypothetical protein